MNRELIRQVGNAILYEGYLLYPYRASAVKNRHRWTFGALYPPAYCSMNRGAEISSLHVECLIHSQSSNPRIIPTLRFLHLLSGNAEQKANERESEFPGIPLPDAINRILEYPFQFGAFSKTEGDVEIRQEAVIGALAITAQQPDSNLYKVMLSVVNQTLLEEANARDRDEALLRSLVSTHLILQAEGCEFVSLLDPPESAKRHAAGCKNSGWWPVLVGQEGEQDAMLISPIILYDYPKVAAESAGDLFDATEIDEILSLRILTLTEEEKREIRESDERARLLLERTENLPPEQFMKLHGAWRGLKKMDQESPDISYWNPWESKPNRETVLVSGVEVRKGDRVRLRPVKTADIFDIALNGKIATIEAIEEDYDGRIHIAVVVEEDPGRDLGELRQPGHRFFFSPEEVEPL